MKQRAANVVRMWENDLWQQPRVVVAAVALAALLGVGLIWWATALWGPGANSDGLSYLVLSRSVYAGEGYGYPSPEGGVKPMTHFPPGYPLTIAAAMHLTRGAAAPAAAVVNALALVALLALAAYETYRVTHHAVPAAVVAGWLATAYAMQRLYTAVFSETVFMPLVLLVGAALAFWARRPTRGRIFAVGLLAAATVYVRWVGMVVVAWALLWAGWWAWQRLTRREWGVQMALLAAGAGVPVVLLMGFNRWRAGSSTNRHVLWHPPHAAKWREAGVTVIEWLTPSQEWLQHYAPWAQGGVAWLWAHPASALGMLAVLGGILWAAWRLTRTAAESDAFKPWLVRWLAFVAVYFAALVAAITVADASTPMDWRLLAPLFPPLSMMVIASLWRLARTRPWATWAFVLLWGVVLLLMARQARWTFFEARRFGSVLRGARWQEADIWPAVRALPDDVMVMTNELEATLYYTQRPAHWFALPLHARGEVYDYDPVTGEAQRLPYENLDAWAQALASRWEGRCVALVYVNLKQRTEETPAVQALQRAFETHFAGESGWIFVPRGASGCFSP